MPVVPSDVLYTVYPLKDLVRYQVCHPFIATQEAKATVSRGTPSKAWRGHLPAGETHKNPAILVTDVPAYIRPRSTSPPPKLTDIWAFLFWASDSSPERFPIYYGLGWSALANVTRSHRPARDREKAEHSITNNCPQANPTVIPSISGFAYRSACLVAFSPPSSFFFLLLFPFWHFLLACTFYWVALCDATTTALKPGNQESSVLPPPST